MTLLRYAVFLFFPFLFGCASKVCIKRNAVPVKDSVFIEMPENVIVFEDLSPLIYQALWNHYQRVGYALSDHKGHCYRLRTKIKNLDEISRLLSLDILSYGFRLRLILYCQFFNPDDEMIAGKQFTFYTWVATPKNPVLYDYFLRYHYRELLARSVPKIEQHFRMLLFEMADR